MPNDAFVDCPRTALARSGTLSGMRAIRRPLTRAARPVRCACRSPNLTQGRRPPTSASARPLTGTAGGGWIGPGDHIVTHCEGGGSAALGGAAAVPVIKGRGP